MSIIACLMSLITGIQLYRRGRRNLEKETRNRRPAVIHPTLSATNEIYAEIVHEPNQTVLFTPARSNNSIEPHSTSVQGKHDATTALDENFYEELSEHQASNLSLDGELTDKQADYYLSASDLDLGGTDSYSLTPRETQV